MKFNKILRFLKTKMTKQRGWLSEKMMINEISRREIQRGLLFAQWKTGKSAQEAIVFMNHALDGKAYSVSTIYAMWAQFNSGYFKCYDEPRTGRKSYVSSHGSIVPFLKSKIDEDKHISVLRLKNKLFLNNGLNLTKDTIVKIIESELNLTRKVACWVPHNLTNENKLKRFKWCRTMLKKFYRENRPMQNLDWLITCDEVWCYEDTVGHGAMKGWGKKGESVILDKKIAKTNMTKKKSMF